MLVRDSQYVDGRFVDHLLANVEAVVIDEVHLFDGSSRGDQLIWLLGRLRRIRGFALEHGLSTTADLQVCGASATVAHPEKLARRLLGDDAEALTVHGSREIQVLLGDFEANWCSLQEFSTVTDLRDRLIRVDGRDDLASVECHIWRALAGDKENPCRKLLVFVPTRSLCDKLSTHLHDELSRSRDLKVLAHHGSLERDARENAEKTFSQARDAVLVATTTLEVGVDIGDVDGVVLVGPPMDTGGLLQRIGRGGRRDQITRVVPIVRDGIEACAMASMLLAAHDGHLDEKPYARRWSVFVQQAASFVAQSTRGRTKRHLVDLAHEVWPEEEGRETAKRILDNLVENEYLVETNRRITLGEEWSDMLGKGGGRLHNNLNSEAAGVPVVDVSTGEVIARVRDASGVRKSMALGGQRWDVVSESGEILLKAARDQGVTTTFRYSSRAAPTGHSYARHVLAGLGFQLDEAPIIEDSGDGIWLHCGGSAYEVVLLRLFPALKPLGGMKGLAVRGAPDRDHLDRLCGSPDQIRNLISDVADDIAFSLSPGPFHRLLPEDVRRGVVLGLFDMDNFVKWLCSRRMSHDSRALYI